MGMWSDAYRSFEVHHESLMFTGGPVWSTHGKGIEVAEPLTTDVTLVDISHH